VSSLTFSADVGAAVALDVLDEFDDVPFVRPSGRTTQPVSCESPLTPSSRAVCRRKRPASPVAGSAWKETLRPSGSVTVPLAGSLAGSPSAKSTSMPPLPLVAASSACVPSTVPVAHMPSSSPSQT
jgi:hypothetical protein